MKLFLNRKQCLSSSLQLCSIQMRILSLYPSLSLIISLFFIHTYMSPGNRSSIVYPFPDFPLLLFHSRFFRDNPVIISLGFSRTCPLAVHRIYSYYGPIQHSTHKHTHTHTTDFKVLVFKNCIFNGQKINF